MLRRSPKASEFLEKVWKSGGDLKFTERQRIRQQGENPRLAIREWRHLGGAGTEPGHAEADMRHASWLRAHFLGVPVRRAWEAHRILDAFVNPQQHACERAGEDADSALLNRWPGISHKLLSRSVEL